MPLYEYRCEACEHQFEVIRKFSDAPIAVCPKCGAGPVVKLISSPAFQFKGSGWYITDYARKDSGKGDDKADKPSDKPGDSSAKPSESKDAKPAASDSSTSSTSTPAKSDS
jgi:putative FmdB family regulatory protein